MKMTLTILSLAVALAMTAGGVVLLGQATTTPAPAAGVPMQATVKEVTGPAQRLVGADTWQPIKVGDTLDELTIIRTGFGAKVVLMFADNSQLVIDRATKIGIGQFRREGGVTRTSIGLKYGAIRASVDKAKGPNVYDVATPVATAAVAGTDGALAFSGDFGFAIQGFAGVWNVRHGQNWTQVFAGEDTDNDLTPYFQLLTARQNVILGPSLGQNLNGLTPNEIWFLLFNPQGRGQITFLPAGGPFNASISRGGTSSSQPSQPSPPPYPYGY